MADDISACFSEDYFEAREKFLELAGPVVSYKSPALGPKGQDLFTDAAWFGDRDARSVGVLISATHGVEGYCGSAAQIDWMRRGGPGKLKQGQAMLLIHAINPYGFAWDRRVTEEGCDLNRNFIDFNLPPPANPGHDELVEHFVPRELSGPTFGKSQNVLRKFRDENGELAYQIARKSGQYKYPNSIFFGGFGPSNSRITLEKIAGDHDLQSRDLVVIVDAHTGLGPFGYGELQTEQSSGEDGYRRARAIFGQSVTSPDLGTSSSVSIHGSIDEFWERILGERHVYVALEFGTFGQDNGERVLREDCWLATSANADSTITEPIRLLVRGHYDPRSVDWREMVLWRSRQVHRQMIGGLSTNSSVDESGSELRGRPLVVGGS